MTTKLFLRTASFLVAMTASSTLFAQVKVGSNPTSIGSNSNLEVEATDGKKVIVNKSNGTVVIENTPAAASTDKILTVDASGNVRATSYAGLFGSEVATYAAGSVYVGDIATTPSAGLGVVPGSVGLGSVSFVTGWIGGYNFSHSNWRITFSQPIPQGKQYWVVITPRSNATTTSSNNQADADNDLTVPIILNKDRYGFNIFCQESFTTVQQLSFDILVLGQR